MLEKQLARLNVKLEQMPSDIEQWKLLLEKISNTYEENDQERYLNDRSIVIASKELVELNRKLETAQSIAQLGYWTYSIGNDDFHLSKECYSLFGIKDRKRTLDTKQLLELFHIEQREKFKKCCMEILTEKSRFELEMQVLHEDGEYRWFLVIGKILEHENIISGIFMDINQRKKAEVELHRIQEELITTARLAGMAEIASSILHNVGNLLNSVNVSVGLIEEYLEKSQLSKIFSAIDLIKQNKQISNYLIDDARGKIIPDFLIATSEVLKNEKLALTTEVSRLHSSIRHINEIINMQQTHCVGSGIFEKIFLPEIVDAAIRMCGDLLLKYKITIDRIYNDSPFITTDKSKVLQILVNFIQNAKDSLNMDIENTEKRIKIGIQKGGSENETQVFVSDNGVGIKADEFVKIFSFGFTNKEKGHGIGLHTSALNAKDIGATIDVSSDGVGLGATFTLTLPIIAQKT